MSLSKMNAKRRGFTLVELLVVIAIIATLIGLLLPAVQSAREAARRTGCSFNIRGLSQAVMVYESTRRRLPAVTDRICTSGSLQALGTSGTGAGYSWICHVLPYMEEGVLYNNLSANTTKFNNSPWDTQAVSGINNTGTGARFVSIPALVCPSSRGDKTTAVTSVTTGSTTTTASGGSTGFGITNYKAMAGVGYYGSLSGTNYPGMLGTLNSRGPIQYYPDQTGVVSGAGVVQSSVGDGMSKTVMIAETNERLNSAWIDGETAWVVAVTPNGSSASNPGVTNNSWSLGTSTLGLGAPGPYIGGGGSGAVTFKTSVWLSGNSSDHQGGIVMHGFGDTHVSQISGDIEPRVYMAICSRGGSEPDALQE